MNKSSQQIEALLRTEEEKVRERIVALKKADPFMDPEYADDNAAVDTDVREQESHQRIEAEIKTLEEKLTDIAEALERVHAGSYGRCKRCNADIPEKRLEIIPESVYCVQCESSLTR